ncbi:MAG: EamA family transporter [Candidatus Hodarchaeota archaeon]
MKYHFLLAIAILLNCLSLILLKKALFNSYDNFTALAKLSSWISIFTNGLILLSILAFAIAAIAWIISLTKIDLSLAYPTTSLSYVIIAIASYYLFGEVIPLQRWIGIMIIIFGVIIMFHN